MSKKFRLFASVAAPFVSLPLMLQPAGATPMRPAIDAGQMPGVVQVQQQIIVPPGAPGAQEGEGQPRPRRKPPEEQQQAPAERPQAPPQAQQQEQPQRQRKAEPEAAPREAAPREAAPRQAPQAERPAAEAPAQERPRRQQQETGQGQGQGQGGNDAQPRRQREQATPQTEPPAAREAQQPKAAPAEKQAETPKPERPATNRAATPEAAPEAPVRRDAQQPKAAPTEKQAETPKPQPPATNRAATPEATPEKPASGKQADTPKPPQAPATDRAATPGAAPENPARGNATGQAPVPVPGQAPGTGTAQDRRNQQPPVNGQAAPVQPPAAETPLRQSTEGQPAVAPSGQQATGAQPATQPSAPQTATTPQQVERAKELAKDPAAAKSGEQVVLPVQNGAAVLDSAKEAPSSRPLRDGERPRRQAPQQADQQQLAPPKSDAEAQGSTRATREQQQEFRQLSEERGQRLDQRPQFERPRGWDFRDAAGRDRNGGRDRDGGRVIISIDNQSVVRHDDSRRFYNDRDRAPQYEQLRDGRVREIIVRDDGTRIVTVRNSYGEIVQRSRIVRGGEEYVLYYSPELMDNRRGRDYVWRDPGDDLPPMRLGVPLNDYIIDTSTDPDRDYYEFLEQPPVERVERVYSLDEVRYSARIRDKVPRIDLDTVTFATGSAEIPMNQASSLRKVADAISKVLKRDPAETFLIEGHTDAVGADDANLVLSDERAESVARVLTDAFGIPPENLATQGYGERYLKVRTDGPEQENRRVTVRRITPLVKPVASNQ